MFEYSVFQHNPGEGHAIYQLPTSTDYRVFANGMEIPVYTCRISAYPFNTWWPGHQRPLNQTTVASYVNLVSDEAISVEVQLLTKSACERVMIKPYAKAVSFERNGDRISFILKQNGGYVLKLDDGQSPLYLFHNAPIACPDPQSVTYYFGKGIHFAGKIELKSGESIYLDKDALVFGCVFAENAEHIRIFGNGIFDDSMEERVAPHCYEAYTNGNLKLYDCRDVTISGVGMMNSAIWCVNLFHCFDVHMDGINVFGQWRYNTDGIDIVNCADVTIRNSFVHSFDDSITIKGIDRYARQSNTDILVENCVLWCDWGRTMEIGLETECREYKNIVFRNCHVVRAGHTACDIQNGDCAIVHDILFEDISVELESFYTKEVVQRSEDRQYDKNVGTALANFLNVENSRFRKAYAFLDLGEGSAEKLGTPDYASVQNVTVRNVQIYADKEIMSRFGTKCARVKIKNIIPTTRYHGICVENVFLNSVKLGKEDMRIDFEGCEENVLSVI